jgi:hypothetical protein
LARAKQTNRAEARRRFRQASAQATTEGDESLETDVAGAPAAKTRGTSPSAGSTPDRPSLSGAFRAAYHAPHYREDLAALPGLLTMRTPTRIPFTRTTIQIPWFLVSAALVVVGFLALLPRTYEGYFVFQILALPPGGPTLPVLVAGFTATRASYLLGFLVGLLDAVLVVIGVSTSIIPTGSGEGLTTDFLPVAFSGLATSVLFAASAAWYRRFLALSSVRRQQQQRAASKSRGSRSSGRR